MNWGFLENVLSGVNKYSTVIGRIWLSVVFLFRILVYVAAAEQVRLWALQLIMVSTPSLLVALHVAYREHREAKYKRRFYEDKGRIDGGLFCTYTISLVFKTGFEVASLLAFYFLYHGFEVPILLRCSQSPCPNTVDCFIARATEKKIFLYIMGCTSILCIMLNFVELLYIMWKQVWKCVTKWYVPVVEKTPSRSMASIINPHAAAEPAVNTGASPSQQNQSV
ncbi:connexin 28.8 isoform X2 [Thalassophryne amazonica]|uniref:connexin 28.8 isoform X2 n=1 Tax=Thalassophryne amazonica TaxID=390379 RepID=UPI001471ACD2|nr:connexin 28.8 isoform X2 [Thalassophryne amazonica]